jgi:hypothetical protein
MHGQRTQFSSSDTFFADFREQPYSIVPFIIEDSKKMFYYRGLSEWEREKGYLTDTCLDGQDTFQKLIESFGIQS